MGGFAPTGWLVWQSLEDTPLRVLECYAHTQEVRLCERYAFACNMNAKIVSKWRRAPSLESRLSRTKPNIYYLCLTLSGTKTSLAGYYFRNGASFTVFSRMTLAPSLASRSLRTRFRYADVLIGDRFDRVGIQAIVWKDPWLLFYFTKKNRPSTNQTL